MERVRSRGFHMPLKFQVQDFEPNGSVGVPTIYTTETGVSGTKETIVDVVTPGFKKRRANGDIIMSPVSQTFDKRTSSQSNLVIGPAPLWGTRVISGDVCAYLASQQYIAYPDWEGKLGIARDEAVTIAHARVADVTTETIVSVAEAKKTVEMLRSPFQRSRDLVSDMVGRRLRYLKKGMNYAQASVNAYLEVRFGFMPFARELANTAKAYRDPRQNGTERKVARGSRSFESRDRFVQKLVNPITGLSSVQLGRINNWKAKVACGIVYELTEDMDAARARAYGLRLRDLPSALYELVPFSFVLDRYLRLGDWLNAIIPKPGVVIKGGWVTTSQERDSDFIILDASHYVQVDPNPGFTYHSSGGHYNEVIRRKDRVIDISMPTLPPINTGEHSLVQLIDEAALLAQVLKTFDVKQLRRWETYAPKKRWISLYRRHPTI